LAVASDGGDPSRSSTASVRVNIYRNLNTPIFQNTASYQTEINFNVQNAVLAPQGTIVATDADSVDWVRIYTCICNRETSFQSRLIITSHQLFTKC